MCSPAVASLLGRRILVLEDEYLIATELKCWLQEAGAEVVGPVPDVDHALDLIEDHCLDAAVLDINLGHVDNALQTDTHAALLVAYDEAQGVRPIFEQEDDHGTPYYRAALTEMHALIIVPARDVIVRALSAACVQAEE